MAEETLNQTEVAAEPKTFTQEEVNRLMGDLRAKERAKYEGYEEYKAKAAKFDEAEEAAKSELQKALESAEAYKSKLEAYEQAEARRVLVEEKAAEFKVDATLLGRMSGDVEENAKFLRESLAAVPKYPTVSDGGKPNTDVKPREIPRLI